MQAALFETEVVAVKKGKSPCGHQTGCDNCPLNGKKKVLNIKKIKGRPIFVWAEAPGGKEELEGKELTGPAGKRFWRDAKKAGFSRNDCDTQNVVRCRPTKKSEYGNTVNRTPTKEELHHCSLFNDRALAKSKAKVILVLGKTAAETLLGKEQKKGKAVFWSDRLNAKVICLTHPSYFLRPDYSKQKLREYRNGLKIAAAELKYKTNSRFAFLEQQDYKGLETVEGVRKEMELIKRRCKGTGVRLSVDIEDDKLDGKAVCLCVGYSFKEGRSRTVFLDHPDANFRTKEEREAIIQAQAEVLEDPEIQKTAHFGSSDKPKLKKLLGIKMRGFSYDTNYAEYLKYSGKGAYGLAAIADSRFPQFAGYKDVIAKYTVPDVKGEVHYSRIPKDVMVLYNGADADLGKRVEVTTSKDVNLALLKAYTYASFTVAAMQAHGPKFDYEQYKWVEKIVPVQLKALEDKLKMLARNPDFNPGSPQQVVKVMYGTLKIKKLTRQVTGFDGGATTVEVDGTGADILEILGQKHEFPKLLTAYRFLKKMDSTYLKGFKLSADIHKGLLATIWWLTGTITGRMRSGGGDQKKKGSGIVNLQNIHGSPIVENLLISDDKWREVEKQLIAPETSKRVVDLLVLAAVTKDDEARKKLNNKIRSLLRADIEKNKDKLRKLGELEVFFGMDWSQLEIRMLAHMSKDPVYLKVFSDRKNDPHSVVGADLTGLPVEKVKNDRPIRTMVKGLHFAMVFGKKPKGIYEQLLAEGVKTTLKKVTAFYDKYFQMYEGVKKEIARLIKFADEHRYTESIFGFRREIMKQDDVRETFWGNQAVNSPVQGGAHQLMVIAMAILYLRKKAFSMFKDLRMEIHDSLYSYVKLKNLPEAYRQGTLLMEEEVPRYVKKWFGFKLLVPLVAEAKAGFRLGATTKYAGESVEEFLVSWLIENMKVEAEMAASLKKLNYA